MRFHKSRLNNVNTLRSRYKLLVSVMAILVLAFSFLQFLYMDNLFTHYVKEDLITACEKIQMLDKEDKSVYRNIFEIETSYNVYVEIYHPRDMLVYTTGDNNLVFNSQTTAPDTDTLKPRIMKILGHKDINSNSYFETRQEYYATAEYIVYGSTTDEYTIELYYPVDIITDNARTSSWSLLVLTLSLFLVFILIVVFFVRSFINPIEQISGVTKKLTTMDFSNSCKSYKIKELKELSESVNALSASLEFTLDDLKNKNKKLQKEIEKEHTLERTRREFIANASHELKTPISIIQGYAEGLKYDVVDGSFEEYCDTIIDESEKMNTIVLRLLEITKYDYGGYRPKYETFNIREVIEKILKPRHLIFKENGVNVINDIDESFYSHSDIYIASEVFSNYLSNAISHIDYDRKIFIKCSDLGDTYRISVINSGIPISDDDMENIWQSFYRADKAHRRNTYRFGLGLSIVASLQNIIGQKYGAVNHENAVEFWFDVSKIHN